MRDERRQQILTDSKIVVSRGFSLSNPYKLVKRIYEKLFTCRLSQVALLFPQNLCNITNFFAHQVQGKFAFEVCSNPCQQHT